ncbi:MAG: HAMP domain-containing histidine kinase [Clostridia bacterium]|nr:HAMP domain-containing histidine kinase [Clostridia bacterium]
MNFEIRFRGIAVRWFLNVFLILAIAVIVLAITFSAIYSSITIERVQMRVDEYAYDFSSLSSASVDTFEDAAMLLAANYPYKDKVEIHLLDARGNAFASTTGFQPENERMDDFQKALKSDDHTVLYSGKNKNRESVLCRTTVLYDREHHVLGGYQWIVSMRPVRRQIVLTILMILAFSILLLGFSAVTGIYFIKSVIQPIKDVSNTARKIAMGDFEAQLEPGKNDEIGELCDAINYMATELKQAETIKNDFISSVSHELRTPLTAIRGWGETAKMSVGFDEELVTRGLDVVLSETDRLSNLVEELLDFSRMQNNRLVLNTQPIDVSVLLHAAVDMYTELARQQGIEISYTAPMASAIIMGDADRLKQVFINIIDNAVKYTEKGGLILVVQSKEEGCVRIQVKDTGVGIPAQDIDHVKEKFFKSNKTVRGSGIGLSVADEIIRQHQGLLFLESTEGIGTNVTIVLPLYDQTEEITETEETVPLAALSEEAEVETDTQKENQDG